MSLDQVGKKVTLAFRQNNIEDYEKEVEVIMVIKTPRGELSLFGRYISPDSQCEAIKRFMEEHKDD